jgi:hypothetical protein
LRKHIGQRKRAELRGFLLVTACAYVPSITAILLITATDTPDLSELNVIEQRVAGRYRILNWSELSHDSRHNTLRANSAVSSGAEVQLLGYMVDADTSLRHGDRVSRFVLLPCAGNALHAAHRFGDQMIDVRLEAESATGFSERDLAWASGVLRMVPGDPREPKPLYRLEHAHVRPAGRGEISKYFR